VNNGNFQITLDIKPRYLYEASSFRSFGKYWTVDVGCAMEIAI